MFMQRVLLNSCKKPNLRCQASAIISSNSFHLSSHYNKLIKSVPNRDQEWAIHHKAEESTKVDQDVVRKEATDEQDECLFPILKTLGVQTEDRIHKFSASCDSVVKFIKVGVINKMIGLQYCHYLAHLARTSQNPEEVSYYEKRCVDLNSFLMKHTKDLAPRAYSQLLCDVANTTPECTIRVCKQVLENTALQETFTSIELSKLVRICYNQRNWELASQLVNGFLSHKVVSVHLVDSFVDAVISQADIYKKTNDQNEKNSIRSQFLRHFKDFVDHSTINRTQFSTRSPEEFVKALQDLDVRVFRDPIIKMNGRCTKCDNHLPLYDNSSTKVINETVKGLLHRNVESAAKLYFNTTAEELKHFEQFLKQLYEVDRKPIDCVVDGLNVAYRRSQGYVTKVEYSDLQSTTVRTIKKHKPEILVQILINTIIRSNMLEKFNKIVVIGRNHMRKWPGLLEFFHKHHIHFFTLRDDSKDDLFQLYAATLHPRTIYVTNDFLRDHIENAEDEYRVKLERWVDTHQTWILHKNMRPVWPTPFEKIPSLSEKRDFIHIPVIDYTKQNVHDPPPHLNSLITRWICCDLND